MMAIGFIIVVAVVVFALVAIYNNLVRLRNYVKNSYAQIDVQLKRRYDLIPNLVETAKGYMQHESATLEAVIRARNSAQTALDAVAKNPNHLQGMKDLFSAEQVVGQSLGKLFALAESYPDLKANQTMNLLMEELVSTENKIGYARQAYNDAVMGYNNAAETFPAVLFAAALGFEVAVSYSLPDAQQREPVKVSFS